MKNFALIIGILVVLSVVGSFFYKPVSKITDVRDGTYLIDGQSVTLVDGVGTIDLGIDSASSKSTIAYFGNEAVGDLNNDGVVDKAFLVTKTGAGSGTFYYLVGALRTTDGYVGTDAVFLGDRIAPQTTEIRNGLVIVNYADRSLGESFAISPSHGKSVWLKVDPKTLKFGEVVQNFEGESDSNRLNLSMQKYTSDKLGITFFIPGIILLKQKNWVPQNVCIHK
ncbi:MAG: hypothetical protein RLZZ347_105 [Candidatus Parcubacteria bacterium]|jgi:hypothetical protein